MASFLHRCSLSAAKASDPGMVMFLVHNDKAEFPVQLTTISRVGGARRWLACSASAELTLCAIDVLSLSLPQFAVTVSFGCSVAQDDR